MQNLFLEHMLYEQGLFLVYMSYIQDLCMHVIHTGYSFVYIYIQNQFLVYKPYI